MGYLLAKFYSNGNVIFDKDREFAHFIISDLPIGIKGILVAGVFSAAMSTLSSSINSLTSSTFIDFDIKFTNKKFLLEILGNDALIITGIKIASFTYGIIIKLFYTSKD